jgi:hypothetical protein
MSLSKLEREVITDSMLKIQSIQAALNQIDETRLVDRDEIDSCLETADNSFRVALREGSREEDNRKR